MPAEKISFFENPDNRSDTESRLKALEGKVVDGHDTLGRSLDLDEAGVLGYSDAESSTVRDWIRDRTQAAPDTTGEFDEQSRSVEFAEQPISDYEKEEIKLRNLTEKQLVDLLKSVEQKSREGRGLYSHGDLIAGYAIDPDTLKYLQSRDHDRPLVFGYLADKIAQELERSDPSSAYVDPFEIENRLVYGLVYLEVPGFKTPIVRLNLGVEEMGSLVPEEKVAKIENFLKRERKLLVIKF